MYSTSVIRPLLSCERDPRWLKVELVQPKLFFSFEPQGGMTLTHFVTLFPQHPTTTAQTHILPFCFLQFDTISNSPAQGATVVRSEQLWTTLTKGSDDQKKETKKTQQKSHSRSDQTLACTSTQHSTSRYIDTSA